VEKSTTSQGRLFHTLITLSLLRKLCGVGVIRSSLAASDPRRLQHTTLKKLENYVGYSGIS